MLSSLTNTALKWYLNAKLLYRLETKQKQIWLENDLQFDSAKVSHNCKRLKSTKICLNFTATMDFVILLLSSLTDAELNWYLYRKLGALIQ